MEKVVSVRKLVEDLELEVLSGEENLDKEIVIVELHRPSVELTGYLVHNESEIETSIHIWGKEEMMYLNSLSPNIKEYNFTHYINYDFPCLILTELLEFPENLLNISKISEKPILRSKAQTKKFKSKLRKFLQKELGPEIILNKFTLLEVFGVGIMILGEVDAKIGVTIELLEKGHRFITDKLLVVKKPEDGLIVGESGFYKENKEYNYYLTIQGGEEINVIDYYGIGAIRRSKQIDLIIKFEKWQKNKFYDRLGLDVQSQYLLGTEIPKLIIPVRKGRNMSIILETAAINERLKKSGRNSAIYFLDETKKLIDSNSKKREDKDMELIITLPINEIVRKFDLQILNGQEILDMKKINSAFVHRPSLEFAGFFDIMEENGKHQLQILGESEIKYLDMMATKKRADNLSRYFSYDFPALVLTEAKSAPEYFLNEVKKQNKVLLTTEESISSVILEMNEFLEKYFAPTLTMHGVFVEVFGYGVLITGKSGIGKSETALDLIHRGHRLIADDMVKFTRFSDGRLVGSADKVPYFMEIRGLGIIDIKTLYGLGSVREAKKLDVLIELKEIKDEEELPKKEYEVDIIEILEEEIPKIELHISSGRNAASMVEISTMNLRAKNIGYDSEAIYKNNVKNIKKITNKKENIFQNLGQLLSGGNK